MGKMFKNFKSKKRGAISTVVLFTILMFIVILMGVYAAITINEKSQLQSDMKIQEIYGRDSAKIDMFYLETSERGWNQEKKVNKPLILTGMTPIKFNEPTENKIGSAVETTENDAEWYQYGITSQSRKWANAETEDGSMWVWIPRYAYKIDDTNKKIDVKFLIGTTDYYIDNDGEVKEAKRQGITASDYIVHPAFRNGSGTGFVNGEWRKELTGIWVAKFEAGYASGNNSAHVKSSSESYEINNNNKVYVAGIERPRNEDGSVQSDGWETTRNWLDGIYGENGSENTKIKYPTFQGLTYSMNYINHSDAFKISRALTEDGNIYGFTSDADSHLMKNSEWGAVAYLTQSSYGKNSEIAINNVTLNSGGLARTETSGKYGVDSVYAITGLTSGLASGSNSETTSGVITIDIGRANGFISAINNATKNEGITNGTSDGHKVYTWNQYTGQNASTTGTIYGIYDMSGGMWERTSGFTNNGSGNITNYGLALKEETEATAAGEGASTEYVTIYPYSTSTAETNGITNVYNLRSIHGYAEYAKLNSSGLTRYGDAILEITDEAAGTGETNWNNSAGRSLFRL